MTPPKKRATCGVHHAAAPNPLTAWHGTRRALVARREDLKLTQGEAAGRMGASTRSLQRWEAGDAAPGAFELYRWCAALGVELRPAVVEAACRS